MTTTNITPPGMPPLQSVGPLSSDVHKNPSPLRYPALEENEHLWIISAVVVPVIVVFGLCVLAACIYRKRRAAKDLLVATDQYDPNDFNSSQLKCVTVQEKPPSYEIVSETYKKLTSVSEKPSFNEHTNRPSTTTGRSMSPPSYRFASTDFTKSSSSEKITA